MRTPTNGDVQHLLDEILHVAIYDPIKAHEYYERTKQLKGRKPARIEEDDPRWDWRTMGNKSRAWRGSGRDPRIGKTREQIHKEAKAKQRKELTASIASLQKKVDAMEAKIRELMREETSEDRKGKAKKERAAKERDKPDTAAEKAEKARENKEYREKHQQELKSKAKKDSDKSDGKKKSNSEKIDKLKAAVTKMKGQIAVAKQKLAAL